MFPTDTLLTHRTLVESGAGNRFEGRVAAENAARLQIPGSGKYSVYSGGFDSIAGDILGPWVRSTWGGIELADEYSVEIDRSAAATFFKRTQRKSGGFGPRFSFFGSQPLPAKMGSTFYAIAGLQKLDALDAKTKRRVEEFLKRTQQKNGAWPISELGGDETIGSTYHAVRALDSVGSLSERRADRAGSFVRSRQQKAGGFYNVDEDPGLFAAAETDDSDGASTDSERRVTVLTTARGVLALDYLDRLDAIGADRVQQHAEWLADLQFPADDGRAGAFRTFPDGVSASPNYSLNTRMALDALRALTRHGASVEVDREAAVDYLLRCRNDNTGGVGIQPDYLAKTGPTAAATRTLADLDIEQSADALAEKFSRLQRENGRIPLFENLRRGSKPKTEGTGKSLVALANVDRLDAVDVEAAVDYIASLQRDEGYFTEFVGDSFKSPPPDFVATTASVFGLAAAGALDRIDRRAAGEYFATKQDKTGRIARYSTLNSLVADTSRSLRALDELGQLELVDVERSVSYLAGLAADDGRYWPSPPQAGWAVQGLAAADALDRIDTEATKTYLERNQYGSGGYAGLLFYRVYSAVEQNAATITGLEILGGSPDAGQPNPPSNVPGGQPASLDAVDTVLRRVPGRGWQRTSVEALPENRI